MIRSQRKLLTLAAPAAVSLVCLASASVFSEAAERRSGGDDVTQQSQQAADALVAIGKSSVLDAQNDEEAINRRKCRSKR